MDPAFEMLRAQLGQIVPFAAHTGIEITDIESGAATALLPDAPQTKNHIGSQHAGALFTLAEAASGAAMSGAFLPVLMSVRPVAAACSIRYTRVARGPITAAATLDSDTATLHADLEREGKVRFPVNVTMHDEQGEEVASMVVDWYLSKAR